MLVGGGEIRKGGGERGGKGREGKGRMYLAFELYLLFILEWC